MKSYMRKGLILLALAGAVGLISGCGDAGKNAPASSSAKPAVSSKVLKVATEPYYPPFRYWGDSSKNQMMGFEIDLMNAVAKEMGMKVEWKDENFDRLISSVEKKDVDLAIAAITINEKRKERIDFSDPYYKMSKYLIIVPKGSRIKTEDDLKDKIVATKKDSTSEAKVILLEPEKIVSKDHYEDVFQAVTYGNAEAAVSNEQAAMYYLRHGGSDRLTVGGSIPTENNFGIAVSKDNQKLKEDVNKALKKIMTDGTYDKLSEKWFSDRAAEKN